MLQRSLDMKAKAVRRIWEEFDRNPSPHSVANLGHALRGLLSDIDKIAGVVPPSQVQHKVDVRVAVDQTLRTWHRKLNYEELEMLELLANKAGDEIPEDTDVVSMAFDKYRRDGTLRSTNKSEIIEIPDFLPDELMGE